MGVDIKSNPSRPVAPRKKRIVALGLLAGLLQQWSRPFGGPSYRPCLQRGGTKKLNSMSTDQTPACKRKRVDVCRPTCRGPWQIPGSVPLPSSPSAISRRSTSSLRAELACLKVATAGSTDLQNKRVRPSFCLRHKVLQRALNFHNYAKSWLFKGLLWLDVCCLILN